jgi:hypothetical protein
MPALHSLRTVRRDVPPSQELNVGHDAALVADPNFVARSERHLAVLGGPVAQEPYEHGHDPLVELAGHVDLHEPAIDQFPAVVLGKTCEVPPAKRGIERCALH